MIKSPFLVLSELLSPLECEQLLQSIDVYNPNFNELNKPIKTTLRLPVFQQRLWNRLENYFEIIEDYYNVNIDSITATDIEWYPENCEEEIPRCENSMVVNNKWSIKNDYDFTIIIFLKDYNNTSNFDLEFECYGGRLEFPNHAFAFNPIRGTAIIFPSNQYFINKTESPKYGEAFQIRTHLVCEDRFSYDKDQYQGNHSIWFKE